MDFERLDKGQANCAGILMTPRGWGFRPGGFFRLVCRGGDGDFASLMSGYSPPPVRAAPFWAWSLFAAVVFGGGYFALRPQTRATEDSSPNAHVDSQGAKPLLGGPVGSEAARLYVRGRQAWDLETPAGLDEAEKYFNAVIAIAPEFSRAYAGLADVWHERARASNDGRGEPLSFSLIASLLQEAIARDPELAETRASLGNAYAGAWRLEEAKRELDAAVRLDPSYASAHHWIARLLETDGLLGPALASYRRAKALDPGSSRIAVDYARALFLAGRPAESLAEVDRVLVSQTDQREARQWRAWALMELGRMPDAVAEARRLVVAGVLLDPVFATVVLDRARLRAEADEAFRRIPVSVKSTVAYLVAMEGRRDDIIALMAPAIGQPAELPLLYYLPAFDPIRGHPRFREILRGADATSAHRRAQEERAAWRKAKERGASAGPQMVSCEIAGA